jgi:hypothetical protein
MPKHITRLAAILLTVIFVQAVVESQAEPRQRLCSGLRALDGSCAKQKLVEAADARSTIISTVRVSYYGTPFGSIGGQYVPFERLFRGDPLRDGLPTITTTTTSSCGATCILVTYSRTK